ncbi:hypothetical protein Tco_1154929 [Tanacetum coccineum]
MANLPPNHNEFALAAEAAPNNMNGWIEEEEDPEMEEEEDPEMEEEEEEMDVDAYEEWDGPYLRMLRLRPMLVQPDTTTSCSCLIMTPPLKAEAATVGTGRLAPLTRLFANTQVCTGSSSSSAAVGHDPEDLTPSHIRSDLDALHRRVRQIEEDDVRAENNRLRMMLDCSENRTRAAWRELDRATWHYHNLRGWSIEVQKHLPPHLHYQEAPYVLPSALRVPVTYNDPRDPYVAARDAATAPATDNDDPAARKETSPSEPTCISPPRTLIVIVHL